MDRKSVMEEETETALWKENLRWRRKQKQRYGKKICDGGGNRNSVMERKSVMEEETETAG